MFCLYFNRSFRKVFYLIVWIVVGASSALAQIYMGPVPKPINGYGSDGNFQTTAVEFPNPSFAGENIRIYYPLGITGPRPTIFYSHGFGGNNPLNINGLLQFIAKKGYVTVFVPYQTFGASIPERYQNLLGGFTKAARDFSNLIDTTKVGFMGHSFGGGACFGLARECFQEKGWGSNGRFLFASAQWYSYNISQTELVNFPKDVQLITMVYEDDVTNDLRMAMEVFNNIGIPDSEKDFLMVKSDTLQGYIYDAIHGVPNTASAFDALDYYAIYRILDALCDYTFNGNLLGKTVALGNGSMAQVQMPGGMKSLVHSNAPSPTFPESRYNFPCSNMENPRREYCEPTTQAIPFPNDSLKLELYPNPVISQLTIRGITEQVLLQILNADGRVVYQVNDYNAPLVLDLQGWKPGFYVLQVRNSSGKVNRVKWVLVNDR